jgi:hypothetical protein
MKNRVRTPGRRDISIGTGTSVASYRVAGTAAAGGTPRADKSTPRTKGETVIRSRSGQRGDRILFVAANPRGSDLLKLGEECANIQRELRMTLYRDQFRFESRWAVSVDDLMRHLTELDPSVVHFSGHGGGAAGLVLQDEQGEPQPVSARALAMMVHVAAPHVRVVVLNACYSTAYADALRIKIDCIVGMDGAIGDDAARAFATRFYGAVGNGRSIGDAVAHGVASLAAKQLPDEILPRCVTRDGVDAHDVMLGRSRARAR